MRARTAPATSGIIVTCVVVYLAQLIPGLNITAELLYAGAYSFPGTLEPWRMLTSAFAHSTGSVLHILLNMYTLWIFGRILEPFLGTGRFVALYVLSAWAGSVGVLWWASPLTPVIGASGAVFGVIGAYIMVQRTLGGSSTQLYILLAINLVIGFIPGMAIAWESHVGGLIVGVAVGWLYVRTRRTTQQRSQLLGLLGIAVLLVLLSARFFLA
ncbi:MAG TPA: rhomboid family intramembrane serine protease [Microbacteriaceae bacterium]|nr:rhomboid family intramembrane serine protease [Microbacteriaceae bacterium]